MRKQRPLRLGVTAFLLLIPAIFRSQNRYDGHCKPTTYETKGFYIVAAD
jgi:hypothetical protein